MEYLKINSALSDWSTTDRLDFAGSGAPGYQVYGRTDLAGGALHLALKTDGMKIGPNTTVWLNTDRDPTTGYQIWGRFGGAEYNVNFRADPDSTVRPYLYSGGAGENLIVETPLEHAYNADRSTVAFAIPLNLLHVDRSTNPAGAIDLLIDINDTVFLPVDYSGFTYTVLDPTALPTAPADRRPAAIVYSETSSANYFDPAAYSDLLDLVHQSAQARGVPLTILAEDDLAHLDRLLPFGTLIFPAFQNVTLARYRAIQETLHILCYRYGTDLVAAGNFMTNDEHGLPLPGDPYSRMRSLLNVMRTGGANGVDVTLCAGPSPHPALEKFPSGDAIQLFPNIATHFFNGIATNYTAVTTIATQIVGGRAYDGVIATRTGGQNLFFCVETFLSAEVILNGIADLIGRSSVVDFPTTGRRSSRGDGAALRELPLRSGLFSVVVG